MAEQQLADQQGNWMFTKLIETVFNPLKKNNNFRIKVAILCKRSARCIYMLFSQFLYTTALVFYIRALFEEAGFSAWVAIVLGALLGLLFVYGAFRLGAKRSNQFFMQFGSSIIGKWLHYPLSGMMILSFLVAGAIVLRELEDLVARFYLRDTPNWAIAFLFGFCIFRAARSVLGTIFRGSQGIFFSARWWSFCFRLWWAIR